jgi:hypothetical protein
LPSPRISKMQICLSSEVPNIFSQFPTLQAHFHVQFQTMISH